ncbi:unnamed protein product [Phaedon cochleariae]|uniref:Transmembrane protein n=1 Tax=Phaedon cochleariae TaxID=80249 RepID=A0A9P0DJU1_PHACE|nr:unnamed protein product [Phaedon cochleariae]
MSGQWEVVGKKKGNSKLPVPKVSAKDNSNVKSPVNGSKIEDSYPKLPEKVAGVEPKIVQEVKKSQEKSKLKLRKPQRNDRPSEPQKPKSPKSIETGLNSIDVKEFESIYETSKNRYPDAPIVWLKELVYFLNQKMSLEIQDPVFSSKPQGYPISAVPSELRGVIEKSVKEAGKNNAQQFFDFCLTSMATDMGKGLPALGYKFFLQYIALNEPVLITSNVNKHRVLRNSYQNRLNIGLSILWAVGNVAYSDFNSGVTVFRELFLPVIDIKSYSPYILSYLKNLISNSGDGNGILTKEDFLLILDIIYTSKKHFPVDLLRELSNKVSNLKPLLFVDNKEKYHSYIELLLKKVVSTSNKSHQNCLCDILVEVFQRDSTTFATWRKIYPKNVASSVILLEFIGDNWDTISKRIDRAALKDLLNSFQDVNDELSTKKRKEDGLRESINAIQKINEKMAAKKKSSSSCRTLSLLVIIALAGLVLFDIKQNTWDNSRTRKALKDYRVCEYSQKALNTTREGLNWLDGRIEQNFPAFRKTVIDFSEPYVELAISTGKITRNGFYNMKEVVLEKYPLVLQSIESYAPGLMEQSQKALSDVYSSSVLYCNRGIDYLRKEVFVGQLSPENVQRVVIEAFNTTQQKATEYYHWIYKKVQTTIK